MIMAFDFGTQKMGMAVGQAMIESASPLALLPMKDGIPNWDQLLKIVQQHQPTLFLVGLPLNMDGTEQPLTARARNFANKIHGRFGVAILLHDERLSTVEARAGLFAHGGYRALNKGSVDSASAVVILESYFEQGF